MIPEIKRVVLIKHGRIAGGVQKRMMTPQRLGDCSKALSC